MKLCVYVRVRAICLCVTLAVCMGVCLCVSFHTTLGKVRFSNSVF